MGTRAGSVFAVAQAALADFADLLSGRQQLGSTDQRIARHSGRGMTVFVDTALAVRRGADIAALSPTSVPPMRGCGNRLSCSDCC